jgi:excisionase family DNA binding protein
VKHTVDWESFGNKSTFHGAGSSNLVEESKLGGTVEMEAKEPLLTVQAAARYLAVSVSTLYGWVWQRRVPFVKIGRALRFVPHDLEAFVEASKQSPRQEISRSGSHVPVCYNTRAAGKG